MVTLEEALKRLLEGGKEGCMYFDPRVTELEMVQSKIETAKLLPGRIIITSEIDLDALMNGISGKRRYTVIRFGEEYDTIEVISKPREFETLKQALAFAKLRERG